MSDVVNIINGAHLALTIIRDLQKAVNSARDAGRVLDVEVVQKIVQKNLDAEIDWDASKAKRLAELEAEAKKPAPKKPRTTSSK